MPLVYNYDKLLEDALQSVLADYSADKVQFHSEHDFLCNVFYECRKLMEKQGFPTPLKLYAQKSVETVSSKQTKVDLVLGNDDVLVEFKLEPDYPGVNKPVVFDTKKQGTSSIEGDIEKIRKYCSKGKFAHFTMIDEDGMHSKKDQHYLPLAQWKNIGKRNKKGKNINFVHIKCTNCGVWVKGENL
jgi:hypothetical protein